MLYVSVAARAPAAVPSAIAATAPMTASFLMTN
jgi:hypothetical protein